MLFRFIKLFCLVLLLFGFTSTSYAQVELPFDYFYGRWVDGYFFEGDIQFKDLEIDKLKGYNTFLFTNNSLQIKVAGLGNHILWDELDWGDNRITKKSPIIDVNFRPSNKWQLGVDGFVIKNSDYSFNLNSIYMSDSTIKISEPHAPYAYIYKNILSKGNYILENRLEFDKFNSYNFLITNSFNYGLTDDINLSTRFTTNHNDDVSSFSPSYSFSVLSGLLAPFYVDMSIKQSFRDSKFKEKISTILNMNMTYISKGKFDQKVILADYQNYYKKMLFQNQFLFSLDIETFEAERKDYFEDDNFRMQLKSAYGITSQLNIEGQINYSNNYNISYYNYYDRFYGYREGYNIFSSEYIYSNFNISYLSNSYGITPTDKWNSDSKYDIMFGSILKAKEYYLQLTFTPPSYSSFDETKHDDLGFTDLESSKNYSLDFYSLIGVGKESEVGANIYFRHNNETINSYFIELSGSKRVYDKFYFSFELLKSFSQALGSTIILGSYNPYRITAQLKLAL